MKTEKSREMLALFPRERDSVTNMARDRSRKAEKEGWTARNVFLMEKTVRNTGSRVLADLIDEEAKVPVRTHWKREGKAFPRGVHAGKKSFLEMNSSRTILLKGATGMIGEDAFPAGRKGNILSKRIAVLE